MLFGRKYSSIRRSPRQWWNSSVEVFTDSAKVKAVGVNISDGGMCLFAVANLHIGSPIEVAFHPTESREHVRLRGTVRHRALYLYGIEFLDALEPRNNSVQMVAAASRDKS
jgi:c-di-GMP-binding flagellar brake protein YcgR